MQEPNLRTLDRRTVAVEMSLPGRNCVLKGTATYDARGEFGPALRVGIKDPAGDFEIVLKEGQWRGQISSGEKFECDYAVQLDSSCLCPN